MTAQLLVQPLVTEKMPRNQVSKVKPPEKSIAYPVASGQNWKSIAQDHRVDAWGLIKFNFQTTNPDEVNWYLREYVGCHEPTPDRMNWRFSNDCKSKYPVWSGKIYIPTETWNFKSKHVVEGKATVSPVAHSFAGPGEPLARVSQFFDIFTLADVGLTILGAGAAVGAFMLGAGIVVTVLSPWAILGGLAEPALNELRKQQMMEGMSLGIVLGAQGLSNKWIASQRGYVKTDPVRNIHYPAYGKQLQGIYNGYLLLGLAHGRNFNTVATVNLFEFIWSQMSSSAKDEYSDYFKNNGDVPNWPAAHQYHFYKLCAGILSRQLRFR